MGKVFISYSHNDEKWKDRVLKHLGVLVKENRLTVWDDRQIAAGQDWFPEIKRALEECDVALLLVSVDFLNSGFILNQEVPKLLSRRLREGTRVVPVILRDCLWSEVSWLKDIQVRPKDGKPLASFSKSKVEAVLTELAKEVMRLTAPSHSSPNKMTKGDQPDTSNVKEDLEHRVSVKADAEFAIIIRRFKESPFTKERIAKIKANINRSYSPFAVLDGSIEIRVKNDLLPLISELIQAECKIRKHYYVPFTEARIQSLRDKFHTFAREEWRAIINGAYNDASEHVAIHVGRLLEYKDAELKERREKLLKTSPTVLLAIIDENLQKALADSL